VDSVEREDPRDIAGVCLREPREVAAQRLFVAEPSLYEEPHARAPLYEGELFEQREVDRRDDGRESAIRSKSAFVVDVDVRPSRSSFPGRQKTASWNSAASGERSAPTRRWMDIARLARADQHHHDPDRRIAELIARPAW
jgi:hypothetical protein